MPSPLLYAQPTLYWAFSSPCAAAAAQGDENAQYNVGWAYKSGEGIAKNAKKAFEWHLKSAEQGDPDAQNHIGNAYELGEGTNKNAKKAFFWYQKAF